MSLKKIVFTASAPIKCSMFCQEKERDEREVLPIEGTNPSRCAHSSIDTKQKKVSCVTCILL